MEDEAIVRLYFARSEQAIAETDSKYGGYCYSIANHILFSRFSGQGGEIAPSTGEGLYVVLKDSTRIALENVSGGGSNYRLHLADMSTPIPLDQVKEVLLPDGQVLKRPD